MKRLPWKYTAGLFDGEGCVKYGIRRKSARPGQGKTAGALRDVYYPQVVLELTLSEPGFPVIDMLHNSYGGRVYHRESKNPNWKDTRLWRVADKGKCRLIANNIVKHTYIKREQLRLALWVWDNLKGIQPHSVALALRDEFSALKGDPHRLSEKAQVRLLEML